MNARGSGHNWRWLVIQCLFNLSRSVGPAYRFILHFLRETPIPILKNANLTGIHLTAILHPKNSAVPAAAFTLREAAGCEVAERARAPCHQFTVARLL